MSAEGDELLRDGAQQPEVVVDGNEGQRVQRAGCVYAFVCSENLNELGSFGRLDVDDLGIVDIKKVEEGVGGMRVVSAEGLKTELTVHEDDCVARFEEVLCRSGSASSWHSEID